MRLLEGLLWRISAVSAGWWVVRRPPRLAGVALAMSVALLVVLQAAVEGARVHLVPTYGLALGLAVAALRRTRLSSDWRKQGWFRIAAGIPVAVLVIIGGALPLLFPVFTYSTPSGPNAIGTVDRELLHGPKGRDLAIQVWYPARAGSRGPRAGITTRPDLLEAAFASFTGLPSALFQNIGLVRTHAIRNAQLAAESSRYPVVLFSHGPLGANRSQSVFQMEALASRGFIVVAIDHTGYASTTIFPDGHAVPPGPDAAWPVFVDARSTAMLNTWVADVRFVVDQLEALNGRDPSGLLTGRLDLSRVGYIGASFGGSVVVQALLDEPRIKAGLAQDGKPYFSDRTLTDLRRPLMYMQSAAPYMKSSDAQLARWGLTSSLFKSAEQDHYARQMQLFGRTDAPIYNVYIRGTDHVTFSDLYLIVNIPAPARRDIRQAHAIINDYTVAFFDRYLNGITGPLVDGRTPSPYPDVTVASRNVEQKIASAGPN